MKPHRIRMTHNLLLNYGLYRKMEIYVRYVNRYTHVRYAAILDDSIQLISCSLVASSSRVLPSLVNSGHSHYT